MVSQYNHIIARKDTSGIEAIRPAKSEERLAISETATTTTAVIKVLIKIYIKLILNSFNQYKCVELHIGIYFNKSTTRQNFYLPPPTRNVEFY